MGNKLSKDREWSRNEIRVLENLLQRNNTINSIAKTLNRSYNSARSKIRRMKLTQNVTMKSPANEMKFHNDEVSCKFNTNKPLTIDGAFKKFELESSVNIKIDDYEVYFFKVESWDVTCWKSGQAETVKNYLTDVRFKKKAPKKLDLAEDKKQLLDLCKNYSPKISVIKHKKISNANMLELGLYDLHYGKLSIIDTTGETANLEGASVMARNAVTDLVEATQYYNIEKIVFPIGNDWSHINNTMGTTVKGTQMEYTNYLFQIRRQCKEDLIWAVNNLLQVAPVEIVQVPGNHDADVILTIAEILDAYFHNNKNVVVDLSPKIRKSVVYGRNYIGYTHGDSKDIRIDRLPLIFSAEDKEKWMRAEFHEIHLGHIHIKKDQTFIIGDEFNGIRIRWISSLASADSWHYQHGFVKSHKSAEAFIWDKEAGMIGNFSVNVRMK